MKQTLLVLIGAALGGIVGYFAFFWVLKQGFYGLVLPGGLLGIGAGIGKTRSVWLAALCGLAAVFLGLFTEWQHAPFRNDDSFLYFLRHAMDLNRVTLLMIALGAGLGFWMPFRRVAGPSHHATPSR